MPLHTDKRWYLSCDFSLTCWLKREPMLMMIFVEYMHEITPQPRECEPCRKDNWIAKVTKELWANVCCARTCYFLIDAVWWHFGKGNSFHDHQIALHHSHCFHHLAKWRENEVFHCLHSQRVNVSSQPQFVYYLNNMVQLLCSGTDRKEWQKTFVLHFFFMFRLSVNTRWKCTIESQNQDEFGMICKWLQFLWVAM